MRSISFSIQMLKFFFLEWQGRSDEKTFVNMTESTSKLYLVTFMSENGKYLFIKSWTFLMHFNEMHLKFFPRNSQRVKKKTSVKRISKGKIKFVDFYVVLQQ